jgi:predicted nuclease of predicted toxin-antitoxin system
MLTAKSSKVLRELGHEVWYLAEEDSGVSDDDVLRKAAAANVLLLTSDKDLGDLVFRQGKATGGELLLRLSGDSPPEKAKRVAHIFEEYEGELAGAFSVLTRTALRIRKI